MGLTVTVLGSSGTWAGPGNACSGYLVRGGGAVVWVDCGPGTLGNVQEHVSLSEIDALVISHEHPDHWLELPVLRNALKYGLGIGGLPVFGTHGTHDLAALLCGGSVEPTFTWTEIHDAMVVRIGGIEFTFSRTDHPVETLAMRIDGEGRSLGYSADTGADWSWSTLTASGGGRPLDLAITEATMAPEDEDAFEHLSAAQAGLLAHAAGVQRLMITHLTPGTAPGVRRAEAEAAFGGPVLLAEVGQTYDV